MGGHTTFLAWVEVIQVIDNEQNNMGSQLHDRVLRAFSRLRGILTESNLVLLI